MLLVELRVQYCRFSSALNLKSRLAVKIGSLTAAQCWKRHHISFDGTMRPRAYSKFADSALSMSIILRRILTNSQQICHVVTLSRQALKLGPW